MASEHPDWEMQQIGISNVIEKRLGRHLGARWGLKQVRGPMDGSFTANLDRDVLRALALRGAKLGHRGDLGGSDGCTESWTIASFEAASLDEIISWVHNNDVKLGRAEANVPR